VGSKQVIMMHPDSLWTGSQLAMALQAIKGWVGLVLAVIGVKNRTTCDFLFAYFYMLGPRNFHFLASNKNK